MVLYGQWKFLSGTAEQVAGSPDGHSGSCELHRTTWFMGGVRFNVVWRRCIDSGWGHAYGEAVEQQARRYGVVAAREGTVDQDRVQLWSEREHRLEVQYNFRGMAVC